MTIDQTDLPPLQPSAPTGSASAISTQSTRSRSISAPSSSFSLNTVRPILTDATTAPVPILDDAVTDIFLTNNLHSIISSLDVGLLLNDPRVSDLAITLISPNGTRVLLFENRGAADHQRPRHRHVRALGS